MTNVILAALAVLSVQAAEAPMLAPLRFLAGDWQAVNTQPGEAGAFSFRFAVQDRVLIRDNHATYESTAQQPASQHDDLMVVFVEGSAIKADYFDNEGHVIHYAVLVRGDRDVVFISPPKVSEPGYRLSYAMGGDGLLKGQFELAPPGSTDAFKPYLSWTAQRLR